MLLLPRADSESDIGRGDVFQVLLLLRAATADHAALAANDDFVAGTLVLFRAVVIVVAKLLDEREVDVLGRHRVIGGEIEQLMHHGRSEARGDEKECVSTGRSRRSMSKYTQTTASNSKV